MGYNVLAGCDAKHKLFVNNDTGSVNDTHALSPMALDAKELLGVESMDILTDKGYTTAKHLDICTRNGITPYSSPKDHSSHHNGRYPMVDFKYDGIQDTYTCPADQVLATNGSIYDKAGHKVKHYKNREACGACPVRALCTTNKNGRFIERSIYQEALDENQKRVEARPEYYRLRQQVTEHQFGTLKRQWGFTHTLMRGKQNVLSEVNLMMICYNLTRLVSILGPEVLKNRLKRLVPGFSALFEAVWAHMNSFLLPPNTYPNFKPTRNTVLTAL
ncbi:transposase [Aequorivita ciconiae]|uniref:transposase n=1 Tax=Aequorivita ciconiae TaxID=2494375 RepID=UPI0013E3E763|nr:transposase [Aequorivita sp. H23M31]